jgi:hypothetical protein
MGPPVRDERRVFLRGDIGFDPAVLLVAMAVAAIAADCTSDVRPCERYVAVSCRALVVGLIPSTKRRSSSTG